MVTSLVAHFLVKIFILIDYDGHKHKEDGLLCCLLTLTLCLKKKKKKQKEHEFD